MIYHITMNFHQLRPAIVVTTWLCFITACEPMLEYC